MPRTTDAPGEVELRAALRRVIVLDVSPGDFLPSDDPDWELLNDAITEMVALRTERAALLLELAAARPVIAAARALDAAWLDERAHEAEHRALTEAIDAIDWTAFRLGPQDAAPAARDGGEEGERGMTDESYDMTTIEGCIGWGLFRNPPERRRLEAELAELRAVVAAAEAHRAAYVAWHDWRPAAGMGHGHADRYAETREALLAALAARDGQGGGVEGMTTIDDLMYRAYPVLRHYSPQAMALLGATGLTAERFAAITGVDVAAAAAYERALLELRAITPGLDLDELGDCLDRLAAVAPGDGWFASHHAAVRWVRGEILAGKPWSAVRDSDPGHPAPALPTLDPARFRAVAEGSRRAGDQRGGGPAEVTGPPWEEGRRR